LAISVRLLGLDQAAHEQPLHEYHHRHRRQHGKDGGRHRQLPFRQFIRRDEHLLDAGDDRLHGILRGDQQRPQILIPAIDELDHEQGRDRRDRQRQQCIPEKPERSGAVDARGFQQFIGHGHEELAEQQGAGG
jgi:hypothetical protein